MYYFCFGCSPLLRLVADLHVNLQQLAAFLGLSDQSADHGQKYCHQGLTTVTDCLRQGINSLINLTGYQALAENCYWSHYYLNQPAR
jgi:hypothetical protein